MKPSILWSIIKYSKKFNCKFARTCPTLTSTVVRHFSTESSDQKELTVREKIQLKKPNVTKWKRPPFVKNMFIGVYDTHLLAFPEILDREHLKELEQIVQDLNELYKEKVNSFKIDEEKKIPRDIIQDLKEMGLFGRMVPEAYGGLGLTYTDCIRLNETLGLDWSICTTVLAHEFLAVQALLIAGTDAQKAKYLPYLASGKCIAAVCCHEASSGCDISALRTAADLVSDGSSYILNGTKSWVTNAELADLYIVFAKTLEKPSLKEEDLTVFIVERSPECVNVTTSDIISLCGVNTGTVQFTDAQVPFENVLGKYGDGFPIWLKMQESCRLLMGSFTFGILKSLLDHVTENIIDTERNENSLCNVQLVRERLAKVAMKIYVMESLSYYTAAIYDSSENPDCAIESAIVKVFNSEGTLFCLRELMQAVGSRSLFKTQQLERFYRDAQALALFEGSNDLARLYVGLLGCQYAGSEKAQIILKMRNPFFFPLDRIFDHFRYSRVSRGKVRYTQDLAGHIHPSLVAQGNKLEECLKKFELCAETVLSKHGLKVVETQFDPVKLANIAIDLYAMSAVLARCSRSYCIGHKNSTHEVTMAYTFCYDANKRICQLADDIMEGASQNNDGNHIMIGEQIIGYRGFFPEHPLKYNF